MARYTNVRKQDTQPARPRTLEERQQAYMDSVQKGADELFERYGGHDLVESLETMRETLKLYREEIQRARQCEDRESFKWMVKPSEGIRAEREVTRLNQMLNTLRERCLKEANEAVHGMLKQHHESQARAAVEEHRKQEKARADKPQPVEATKENTTAPPKTQAA